MKKRNLLFAIALLLPALTSFSQGPTLTFANSGVIPGDVTTTYSADTVGILPGAAGANITWNFTSIIISPTPTTSTALTPSTTPYSSSFPTATVASNSSGTYSYMKVNQSEYTLLGTGSTSTTMAYVDPQKFLTYPFSYTNTFTDNFNASYVQGIATVRTGVATATADGWGTLKLPSGTYSNVLRVKYVQDIKDSTYLFKLIYHIESYLWYDGTHKNPIYNIVKSAVLNTYNGVTTYSKSVVVSSDVYVGLDNTINNSTSLSVFPNPATYKVSIMMDSKEQSLLQIAIFDMQGKLVKSFNNADLSCGNNMLTIDVADIPRGIYFINIKTNTDSYNKKLALY